MAPSQQIFSTPLTRLFNIPHPVMLAGQPFSSGALIRATKSIDFDRHERGLRAKISRCRH
jgi:hypothetical protein